MYLSDEQREYLRRLLLAEQVRVQEMRRLTLYGDFQTRILQDAELIEATLSQLED